MGLNCAIEAGPPRRVGGGPWSSLLWSYRGVSSCSPSQQRITPPTFTADLVGLSSVPTFPRVKPGWELCELLNILVRRQKGSWGFLFTVHPHLCFLLWVQIMPLYHLLHLLSHLQQLKWRKPEITQKKDYFFSWLSFLTFLTVCLHKNLGESVPRDTEFMGI